MNNPACNEEVAAFIREDGPPVIAQGAGTKAPLCRVDDGVRGLGLSGLNGIVEYEPSEYVISARAGTPLSVINQILRDNDQCLPFDQLTGIRHRAEIAPGVFLTVLAGLQIAATPFVSATTTPAFVVVVAFPVLVFPLLSTLVIYETLYHRCCIRMAFPRYVFFHVFSKQTGH